MVGTNRTGESWGWAAAYQRHVKARWPRQNCRCQVGTKEPGLLWPLWTLPPGGLAGVCTQQHWLSLSTSEVLARPLPRSSLLLCGGHEAGLVKVRGLHGTGRRSCFKAWNVAEHVVEWLQRLRWSLLNNASLQRVGSL